MTKNLLQPAALILGIAVLLIVPSQAWSYSWKSDPNTPDTLTVDSVAWRGDTLFTVDVKTTTDDSLNVAQMVLVWDNPALRLDSVQLKVGRWNVAGYHRWTKSGSDSGVVIAFMPTQKRLPPGSGTVARMFFGRDSSYSFDADFAIYAGVLIPAPPLASYETLFSDLANDPFLPGHIIPGVIAFSPCYCFEHGDLTGDGPIDATDLNELISGIFFNGPVPPTDTDCPHIHRGDFTCDNVYDASDLNALIEYVFFNGTTLCDPCEDLP